MSEPVRIFIERVKAAAGVRTDDELAKQLGCSKQAIASWRRRGTVPSSAKAAIQDKFGPKLEMPISALQHALQHQTLDLMHTIEVLKSKNIVDAVTIQFWSDYLARLKTRASAKTMLSIAAAQDALTDVVRLIVMPVFEHGNEIVLYDFVTRSKSLNNNAKVQKILAEIDLDGNEIIAP